MLQFSTTLRNNRINQVETTLGTGPRLRLYTGPAPVDCAAADVGILLCDMALPSDWLSTAAGGTKTKLGTWSGFGTVAAGVGTAAGHFRFKSGTTTHIQGNVTQTGGGGAMTIDNIRIVDGQPVTVTEFSITDGNG